MPQLNRPAAAGHGSLWVDAAMPCFHKRTMFPSRSGEGRWCYDPSKAAHGAEGVEVPCNNCVGCKVRRTGSWVIRNLWELRDHDGLACFVTLTYANEHLPDSYSVDVRDLQLFLKRLRRRVPAGVLIRFFGVAEYGDDEGHTKRPHFHILLYGWMPPDAVSIEPSKRGLPQWKSDFLSDVWGKGRVVLGEVSRQSISYVAGYIFDKRNGDEGKALYSNRVHPVTGEIVDVRPPFNVTSRRPGIGAGWFDRFAASDAKASFVMVDGRRMPMPGFVTRRLIDALPSDVEREAFKAERRAAAAAEAALHAADNTLPRLLVREVAQVMRAQSLARGSGEWSPERIQAQLDAAGEWARVERERGAL